MYHFPQLSIYHPALPKFASSVSDFYSSPPPPLPLYKGWITRKCITFLNCPFTIQPSQSLLVQYQISTAPPPPLPLYKGWITRKCITFLNCPFTIQPSQRLLVQYQIFTTPHPLYKGRITRKCISFLNCPFTIWPFQTPVCSAAILNAGIDVLLLLNIKNH